MLYIKTLWEKNLNTFKSESLLNNQTKASFRVIVVLFQFTPIDPAWNVLKGMHHSTA